MTREERQAPDSVDTAAGLARLEGYLMANAHVRAARTAAESLADRMPWLTADERTELVRLSTADRIQASREQFEAVAVRARELETQYAARYGELRRRVLCRGVACAAVCVTVCTTTVVLAAHR
ncbi:hypothetical protein E3E14_31605 [Streptomyces sp. ICN441]|uniref:Cytochrome C oxidase subunit I n=1 Tax=Streptomyces tirandamycinicus TaxID=2174846 RepID=A0A2S1T0X6_9ACTN|nr:MULTISPECIES: hypothetical protein [Streptomyces]AWI32312.1 hypothetical protein DDW44_28590 [Streptomyces tirandamycinicus]TFE36328.1 hypothetical protein E3E14_31605 [Streptomyces sp. ICN441]